MSVIPPLSCYLSFSLSLFILLSFLSLFLFSPSLFFSRPFFFYLSLSISPSLFLYFSLSFSLSLFLSPLFLFMSLSSLSLSPLSLLISIYLPLYIFLFLSQSFFLSPPSLTVSLCLIPALSLPYYDISPPPSPLYISLYFFLSLSFSLSRQPFVKQHGDSSHPIRYVVRKVIRSGFPSEIDRTLLQVSLQMD